MGAAVLGISLAVRFSNAAQKYLQEILDKNEAGISVDKVTLG